MRGSLPIMHKKPHKFEASEGFAEHLERRRRFMSPEDVIGRMALTGTETVVDLGAGIGYFSVPLTSKAGQVIAIDSEPRMLSALHERAGPPSLGSMSLVLGDINAIPLADASVDHVFAAFVYHEVADQSLLMKEAARVLRPSGTLTVVDFQKRFSGDGPPIWVKKTPGHVERTASPWFKPAMRYDADVYYQLGFVRT